MRCERCGKRVVRAHLECVVCGSHLARGLSRTCGGRCLQRLLSAQGYRRGPNPLPHAVATQGMAHPEAVP